MNQKIKTYFLAFLGVMIFLTISCKKDSTDTTPVVPDPSSGTITDFDGNVYHSVTIGAQVWMLENLKTTHYRNGDAITTGLSDAAWKTATTEAYAECNNNVANSATYGKLYNWYAVADSRKIAPVGYHVATNSEWNKLLKYLDATTDTVCQSCNQSALAGGMLKEVGTTHWLTPNTGASNTTGFTALPGGSRNQLGGVYQDFGTRGDFWCSTEYSTSWAWSRELFNNSGNVFSLAKYKQFGLSVRCVKD